MINGVSLVIPTLGDEKNLFRLLASVQYQKLLQSVEVILVFNGVSINTFEKISSTLQSTFASLDLKFFMIEVKGVNTARNKGLLSASKEIVFFLDDDCELHLPDTLSLHLREHEKSPGVFAFGGGYRLIAGAQKYDIFYNYLQMRWFLSGEDPLTGQVQHLLGGHFSIKNEVAKKQNLLFNPRIIYGGSESELFARAVRAGLVLKIIDVDVIHHTSESLRRSAIKLFKQGRGKRIIDSRFDDGDKLQKPKVITRLFDESEPDKKALGIYRFIYNYSFWLGYYSLRQNYFKFLGHIARDFFGYLNYKRFDILKKLNR